MEKIEILELINIRKDTFVILSFLEINLINNLTSAEVSKKTILILGYFS